MVRENSHDPPFLLPNPPRACSDRFGSVRVDFRSAQVLRDGAEVELSALEYKLLRYFVENRGAVLSRDELLLKLGAAKKEAGRVWGLVKVNVPESGQPVDEKTFTFELRRDRLRSAIRREVSCG